MALQDRIRVRSTELLSDNWARLTKTTFDYRRNDGLWETQTRETYDRGDGAAVLPYDRQRSTVLLVSQFRYPAFATGHPAPLIEVCAGQLDANDPETAIRKEAEEELGYRLNGLRKICSPYMSPGSVTERISLFLADYSPSDRLSDGGGAAEEGEDIEIIEVTLDDAINMVRTGRIIDAKTMILLQHLKLELLEGRPEGVRY